MFSFPQSGGLVGGHKRTTPAGRHPVRVVTHSHQLSQLAKSWISDEVAALAWTASAATLAFMCRHENKIEDDVPVTDAGELGDDNAEHNEDDTETEREVQAYGEAARTRLLSARSKHTDSQHRAL